MSESAIRKDDIEDSMRGRALNYSLLVNEDSPPTPRAGDLVQLLFDDGHTAPEYIWLRLRAFTHPGYIGQLDHFPLRVDLAPGDYVPFAIEHVYDCRTEHQSRCVGLFEASG